MPKTPFTPMDTGELIASIPSRAAVEILLVTSCYRNQDKLRPAGPLGSYADFPFIVFPLLLFLQLVFISVSIDTVAYLSDYLVEDLLGNSALQFVIC